MQPVKHRMKLELLHACVFVWFVFFGFFFVKLNKHILNIIIFDGLKIIKMLHYST